MSQREAARTTTIVSIVNQFNFSPSIEKAPTAPILGRPSNTPSILIAGQSTLEVGKCNSKGPSPRIGPSGRCLEELEGIAGQST